MTDFAPLLLSFEVALVATALAGLLGIALGAALAQWRWPGREVADALVTLPLVLPPTVLGYYVLVAVGRDSPLGQVWEAATGSPLVFTRAGAILAAAIGGLPLVVKAARSSLAGVDERLLHAARLAGAGPMRAFLTIRMPLARAGLVAGLMLAFARSLGDFGVTLMVAGDIPGRTQTASLAIYDALQAGRDADAARLAGILGVLALAVLIAVNLLNRPRHDA